MKTYLITGGAGFIGSHLCRLYLSKGQQVICVDNLVTGSWDNIADLMKKYKNFIYIPFDIRTFEYNYKIDYILNFACPASPVDYRELPLETMETCSEGIKQCVKIAKDNKAVLLHASTSEVYGDPLEHPQKEIYNGNVALNSDRACYDEGKRYAEAYLNSTKGLDFRIVRIFNTYGENMRANDGRVISEFIVNALQNKPLIVYGGHQTRSFCYVGDLVAGIDKLFHLKASQEVKRPVNLGNPVERSIIQTAYLIKMLCNSKSKVIIKPLPKHDPLVRRPDITRAIKILKWYPNITLITGLKRTIKYFREELKCKKQGK